jgi:hypothetical protein
LRRNFTSLKGAVTEGFKDVEENVASERSVAKLLLPDMEN